LFRLAAANSLPMIFQSEPEEIDFLVRGVHSTIFSRFSVEEMHDFYGLSSLDGLLSYLNSYGHVFFNLNDWSRFVQEYVGVVGSRLHGAILALNSGVPAFLAVHDSRTKEIAEYACIPAIDKEWMSSIGSKDDLLLFFERYQPLMESYLQRKLINKERFRFFCDSNGLECAI